MAMGLIEIFIVGWLTGATIVSIYNFGQRKETARIHPSVTL